MSESKAGARVAAKPARKSFGQRMASVPRPLKIVLWVLLALFAFALPLLEPPLVTTVGVDFGGVLFEVTMYMLVALGLNIVVGYAGLLDLGYVGFYAIGAYTVAVFTSGHGSWPFLLTIPLAVLFTTISGVLLGTPTLRVRGDYLAIVTLGFGEIIRLTAVNSDFLGGRAGIAQVPRPPSLDLFEVPHLDWSTGVPLLDFNDSTSVLTFGVLDQIPYYWMGLTVVMIVLWADVLIKSSRVGRAWEACREDEDAAEMMGVPTFKFKLLAFSTGAFVGGLAGSLYASRQGFVNPDSFTILISVLFLAAVVVGGQGNRWGVLVGAFLVAYLPQRFREFDDWRFLVFGVALMVLATFRPEGLLPPRRTVRAKQAQAEIEALEEGADEETASA